MEAWKQETFPVSRSLPPCSNPSSEPFFAPAESPFWFMVVPLHLKLWLSNFCFRNTRAVRLHSVVDIRRETRGLEGYTCCPRSQKWEQRQYWSWALRVGATPPHFPLWNSRGCRDSCYNSSTPTFKAPLQKCLSWCLERLSAVKCCTSELQAQAMWIWIPTSCLTLWQNKQTNNPLTSWRQIPLQQNRNSICAMG